MEIETKRKSHELIALNHIRNLEEVSRTELAKIMQLSKPKITEISLNLINRKLIKVQGEGPSSSVGGRKPILLSLNRDYQKYVVGVDIGTSKTTVALGSLDGSYRIYKTEKTADSHFPNEITDQVCNLYFEMLSEYQIEKEDILGIGISIGGLVDSQKGVVIHSPNFKWEKINLSKIIEAKLTTPVYVENCTYAMAVGDIDYQEFSKNETILYVNHGYGVGSTVVRNRSAVSNFCEIGHISVPTESENILCYCGNENCLETKASGWAIEWMAYQEFGEKLDAQALSLKALEHDEKASNIFNSVGRSLGVALAASANLVSPAHIIISGGVSLSHNLYSDALNKAFEDNTMKFIREQTKISYSESKQESAVKGIVKLALTKSVFSTDPILK